MELFKSIPLIIEYVVQLVSLHKLEVMVMGHPVFIVLAAYRMNHAFTLPKVF